MSGLTCSNCGKTDFSVIDSRPNDAGIRRRRKCNFCGDRITTIKIETPENKHFRELNDKIINTFASELMANRLIGKLELVIEEIREIGEGT